MATQYPSAGEPVKIFFEGKWHELIVTPRDNGTIKTETLGALVAKTIGTWMRAYAAVVRDIWTVMDAKSACDDLGVEPAGLEPFVTVWNKDYNGMTLTVHSNDNGQGAVDAYAALRAGLDTMKSVMPELFTPPAGSIPLASQQSTPSNITPLPQSTVSTALNPFVRTTQEGMADGLISIETGKTDSPNWSTQALLATKPYDSTAVDFKPKTIVLYPLASGTNVRVKAVKDTMLLEFQTTGGDIAIWKREDTVHDGNTIPSDWNAALQKLGLETVQGGQEFVLPADYIALKTSEERTNKDGQPVQYKNFYGFFNAPEGTSSLPATGTDGLTDRTVKPVDDDRDYSQIPF